MSRRTRIALLMFFGYWLPILLIVISISLGYTSIMIPLLALILMPATTLLWILWYWRCQYQTWLPIILMASGIGLFSLLLITLNR